MVNDQEPILRSSSLTLCLHLENFLQGPRQSIKEKGEIYSGMGSGLVPWISCEDIGAVGVHALTSPQPPNRDFLILGPELLTYNDVSLPTPLPLTPSPLFGLLSHRP